MRYLKVNRERARNTNPIHKKKYLIIFIFIYFLLGVGLTYSYFAYQVQNDSVIAGNVIAIDADLKVELVVGNNNGMVPMMDSALSNALNAVGTTNGACIDQNGNLSCQVYKITLTNNGSTLKNLKGSIELSAKTGASNAYSNLKWTEITNPTTLKEGSVVNGMSKSTLVTNLTMASKEEKVWYISVWISETDTDQTNTDKGEFQGTVTFETDDSFITTVMQKNAQSDASIDFSKNSYESGTNGIYLRSGTESSSNPIYYYRGNVNNNNLLFANTCWKIVRTTETGGLKLIYNGVPNIKLSEFNKITQSQYINITNDTTYPYTYDTETNQWFGSDYTNSNISEIQFSVQDSGDYYLEYNVAGSLYYVAVYIDDELYLGVDSEGTKSDIIRLVNITSSNVIKIQYGNTLDEARDDTYFMFSIGTSNGETVPLCNNNTGTSSQIGTIKFNSSSTSPAYVGYMYSSPYIRSSKSMSSVTDTYYYGKSVTYSGGTYTLVDTISSADWSSIYNGGLNNNHYSCLSTGTTCSSVYYIFYTGSNANYITLTNGKTVEDALVDMLGADDENTVNYNTTNSIIKGNSTTSGTLDYWYYTNIDQKGYGDYIEDTVWCNDRSIYQLNGWDPNGGSTRDYLYFGTYGRAYSTYTPSLTCSRDIDKFTVSTDTGNGSLDYPVGLLTSDEVMLAGGVYDTDNRAYYLYTGENYWLGAPCSSNIYARVFYMNSYGFFSSDYVDNTYGVRPSISLKPGFSLTGNGDGTVNNPYIVG